jgi:L-alanine-DL-glutamate epimerase-like enolase superfamily enzyme
MLISRRDFSKSMALAAMAGVLDMKSLFAAEPQGVPPQLTIDKIEIFPVRYPMVMRFKFFEAPVGLSGRPAVIIKMTASDGTVGWGESVPIPRWSGETLEGAVSTLKNYLIPMLIGRDVFDVAGAHQAMTREIADGFSTSWPITKAGLDIALHDLMGKALKKNVAELWGRTTPDDLLLSWTLNPVKLDDIPALIEKGRARGYENFNVKVAPDKKFDIEMCTMVKKMVPDGFLWADANGGYSVDDALEMAPKLAKVGVAVLEGPLKPNHLAGYQRLVKQGALPILMDEGVVSPVEAEEFIKLKCINGIAMKPSRCGGLTSAVAQLNLLEKHKLMFLGSGLTDPDISLAATLNLYGAYGLKKPAALNGPQFLGESVLKEPFQVVGGRVKIPKGHGLGIEVDEDKVRDLSARTGQV